MKTLAALILLLLLYSLRATSPTVCAKRDMPEGTIVQDSDIGMRDVHYILLFPPPTPRGYLASDRSQVVGHTLTRRAYKNGPIDLYQLD